MPACSAGFQSLYVSGTLSMKMDGTTGKPAVQHMWVRQGCPISPTLFGIVFDGLHDHLQASAPSAGPQLRSGRWFSSLVYADDVVLLSFTPGGLQQLIDGMHEFRASMGVTIRPTKIEVVVFNRASPQPQRAGRHIMGLTIARVAGGLQSMRLALSPIGLFTRAFYA